VQMAENEAPVTTPPSSPPVPAVMAYPWAAQAPTAEAPAITADRVPTSAYQVPPGSSRSSRWSRTELMSRMRTPAAAAVAGGVLLLGIGFGTGYVIGHDRGATGSAASSNQNAPGGQGGQGGQGGTFGGGPGFGSQPGGSGSGAQGQQGQGQGGFGWRSGGTGQGSGGAEDGTGQQGNQQQGDQQQGTAGTGASDSTTTT
jgi:hypothetical protein